MEQYRRQEDNHISQMYLPDDAYLGEYMYIDPHTLSQEELMAIRNITDSAPLDLRALNARLQTLNLAPVQNPLTAHDLASAFPSPYHHQEIKPSDSVSMYHAPSSRRGGTNVDPGDQPVFESSGEDEGAGPSPGGDIFERESSVTRRSPSVLSHERMTMGSTHTGRQTLPNNMYTMRDRLEREIHQRDHQHEAQLVSTSQLATTLTKLEHAETQLRTLQAKLIAERVVRSQVERQAEERIDQMKSYKQELAAAVRALRRAREEGKKTEEEKKRVARAFEEARERLYKYHEELQVRDARARGREEGRAEAWQEAERWMGNAPPIPIEPVTTIPPTVWRTPQAQPRASPYQSPVQWQQPSPQPIQSQQKQSPQMNPIQQPPPTLLQPTPQHVNETQQPWQHTPQPVHQAPSRAPTIQTLPPAATPRPPSQAPTYIQAQTSGYPSEKVHSYAPSIAPAIPPIPQQQPPIPPLPHNHQVPYVSNNPPQYPMIIPVQPQITVIPPPMQPINNYPPHTIHSPPRDQKTQTQRYNPADSYLDRVEHDPKLKSLLSGAPSKTIHTPHTDSQGTRRFDDALWHGSDKPLPSISTSIHPSLRLPSTHPSTHPASRQPSVNNQSLRPRRHSTNSRMESQGHNNHGHHPDNDRYPAFPFAKGHSRQSSYGSIDPASRPLPASTVGSDFRSPGVSVAQTPRSKIRSRMAGALRTDGDIEELEAIAEEREEVARGGHESEQNGDHQRPPSRPRQPPSMPSLRSRPIPVMPAPLAKAATDGSHDRDPHAGHSHHDSLYVPGHPPNEQRHSALGLTGISERRDAPKAPTITVQPPSRSSHTQSHIPSQAGSRSQHIPPTPTHAPQSDSHAPTQTTPTTRQTIIVTEQYSPRQIPLPLSRAPTAYTGTPRSTLTTPQKTKSQARTFSQHPNVSVIDFAINQPLPISRPLTADQTAYSKRAATVMTETDVEEPRRPSSSRPSILKRKPLPDGRVDPHKVPLPASRPPTRTRASYAGTVATIDEVTEEESGRENR